MDYHQILPNVCVGVFVGTAAEADLLQLAGVTAILSLQTDEDLKRLEVDWPALVAHCQSVGLELRRVPIRDFDGEDLQRHLRKAVAVLRELLAVGHTVYLHCTAGVGRSASVLIAYLHWFEGYALEAAYARVDRCRACSPNLDAIRLASAEPPEESVS